MKSLLHRLSPDQWDAWYSQGRAIDRLVTDAEVDRFLQHVNPHAGASVLDVGCGIGSFSRQLSRWGYDVLGLDFSPIAIRTAHRQGVNGRLHYGVHDFDAGAIPPRLQPGSLDLIVCRNILPFIDHPVSWSTHAVGCALAGSCTSLFVSGPSAGANRPRGPGSVASPRNKCRTSRTAGPNRNAAGSADTPRCSCPTRATRPCDRSSAPASTRQPGISLPQVEPVREKSRCG